MFKKAQADQMRSIIRETLKMLGDEFYSEGMVELIFATGIAESNYDFIQQVGGGPAKSFFQIESGNDRRTFEDCFINYLHYKPQLLKKVLIIAGETKIFEYLKNKNDYTEKNFLDDFIKQSVFKEYESHLLYNISFAAAIAAILYIRRKVNINELDSIDKLASTWKEKYNTKFGAGTVEGFKSKYNNFFK
jgi:hypothetical protein